MTINYHTNSIAENTAAFQEDIRQKILALKLNKGVKFKTKKGVFGVFYSKRNQNFDVTLDGYSIEEVATAEAAAVSVLSLYAGI